MRRKQLFGLAAAIVITAILMLWFDKYFKYTDWIKNLPDDKKIVAQEILQVPAIYAGNKQEVLLLKTNSKKASADEVPTIKGVENTYQMLSTLNSEDSWAPGRFDITRKNLADDKTYLSLNYSLPIESSYFKVLVNNNSYRILVNKFSKKNKKLGYSDLCNGDILYIDDSVKYITITIYRYDNRQRLMISYKDILKDLKNGLEFSISKIGDIDKHVMDKESLSAEVHIESLSNYDNYRTGWLKSWGGAYQSLDGRLCTRNYYKVDSKPYIFNVNDSRISIYISEYDAKGSWVKFNGPLLNGDTFKKQPKTSYIGLSIKSIKWGVDLRALFEDGLRIDLSSKQYINKTSTKDYNNEELSDTDQWKAGAYLLETGERIIDPDKICYSTFCRMNDGEYTVKLPSGYLKMNILELDQNGKAINSSNFQSGQKWKKSKGTDKIAITVFGYDKAFTLSDYKKAFTEAAFGLEKYTIYNHNTKFKDMTAYEFVNAINVGWNLGNSLDSYLKKGNKATNINQELYWGNTYVTEELIEYVADCGFNTIRIPVTWYYNTYVDEKGALRISSEWLDRVQEVVDYAIANDLYVILNTHHEQPIIYAGADEADMRKVIKNAKELWSEIAEHFRTYDEHLILEAYNEVDNIENYWNYGDKAAAQMNELNQCFVDTVRSTGGNNAKRILIVPTLLDRMDSRIYDAFRMPADTITGKIAVQVHTYSQKFHQSIECDFAELKEFSNKVNAPIIIGEFGTTNKFFMPELRTEHASNFVARAAVYGIKCVWWDNGSDYKIIDRRNFSASDKEMINALLDGSRGIGYQLEQEIALKSPEQFVIKMPNSVTGMLEDKFWRTLTTDIEGNGIKIQKGTTCSVNLKAINEASSIWIQRILFYDSEGELVQAGKEIQSKYYLCPIPENAVTIRVSINSPTKNISQEDYVKYLKAGDIELGVSCFDSNDLKKIKLALPYE